MQLLSVAFDLTEKNILHFSPPKAFAKKLKNDNNKFTYVTSDFLNEFEADKQLDITNTNEPDNRYDLIICYHVLEHIQNDQQAMYELYRILAPGGVCLIQTPFKSGDIYENPNIIAPKDRLQHFGQEDHVRIYSAEGLKSRLTTAGFAVAIHRFEEDKDNHYGFKTSETVLIARKGWLHNKSEF